MTEHEPRAQSSWDLSSITEALSTSGEKRSDPVLGEYLHVRLPNTIELNLYPDTGLVHLSTPESHIALGHQPPPLVDDLGLVFSSRHSDRFETDLTIDRDGAVSLLFTPTSRDQADQAVKRPQKVTKPPKRPETRESTLQHAHDDSEASEHPSETEPREGDSEETENPRVSLVGRLGAAPRFRTTTNDRLIGRFPLAVHHEDESTTWHPIIAFGKRAAKLQADELKQGDLVSVVGYEHERTWTDKNEVEKTEVQIYAAAISRT